MAKSVWDEFKDLFKSNEKREEEKRDNINDALEREKDVVKQLEELDRQYKDSVKAEEEPEPDLEALFPSDSGLRELENDLATDEEIEEKAKQQNEQQRELAQKKLEDDYRQSVFDADAKKKMAGAALEQEYAELDKKYADKAEDAKNDSLEKGTARGSVLSSVLRELTDDKASEAAAAKSDYKAKISEIDDKLLSLERELNAAIEESDMKYAIQLSKDIDRLKKERDEQAQKLEKYNQNIRKQQAEYAYEREQDINEYLAELEQQKEQKRLEEEMREQKYGYEGEKQKNYSKRYDIALEFYMSLDPSIALEAFDASPNMRYYLGQYYYKLREELEKHSTANNAKYYL